MSVLTDVLSWVCLVSGGLFCIIGSLGLLRMPDFYCRTHAAGIIDTMGAGLILLGLMFQAGVSLITFKLVSILAFLWLTSPASTHALAKAAYSGGVKVEGSVEPTPQKPAGDA